MGGDAVSKDDEGVSGGGSAVRKAKRHINGFINYLFTTYDVPRIPVRVKYGYDVVKTPSGAGFGVYIENSDGTNPCIYVGCGKLGKSVTMKCIAHEFVHYMQSLHNRGWNSLPEIESDAEYWAEALFNQYRINKKSKQICIEGVANIWESKPEAGVL